MDWLAIALIAVLLIVAMTGSLYLRKMRRDNKGQIPADGPCTQEHSCSGCCGGTACFNSKIKQKPLLVYFEDEELDRFRHRTGNDYTDAEVEEWNEVLHTLRPEELSAWAKSIKLRRLVMPASVASELQAMQTVQVQ
ncbi:MAG: hypothetical protein Q4E10_02550 [Porphyromonas sp.]|nr:hypothetical protein [Porphyromonas sp.]